MAEPITAALAWVGSTIGGEIGATMIMYATEIATAAATIGSLTIMNDQRRRARNAARDRYNDSLRDRYVMIRGATEPRVLVLGRQRVSGAIGFFQSYGPHRENAVIVLPVAAHEIDGYEDVYFNDEPVLLDNDGYVIGVKRREFFSIASSGEVFTLQGKAKAGSVSAVVRYGSTTIDLGVSVAGKDVTVSGATAGQSGTVTITYQPDPCPYVPTARRNKSAVISLNGSGNGSVTLPHVPVAGSVKVTVQLGSGDLANTEDITSFASVVGDVVTVTGSPQVSMNVDVNYQHTDGFRARVTKYTGAPGQAADAAMIAALPGVWTAAHVGNSIAWLKVELEYDPDAFPGGLPQVSTVVRGAKVYDPRTGATAFSENPSLLMRHAATHALCGRMSASLINDDSVIVAANACDVSSTYVVNGQSFVRPKYTAGLVVRAGTRGQDVLNDLAQAMAGKWYFIDGLLRVKAGAWTTPLQTLDESWLVGDQAVQLQPRVSVQEKVNIITGQFADQERDYQPLDYPQVRSAEYIAADGEELPDDVRLNAVTFTGQAQQVAATIMRDQRFSRRLTVTCNMRAYAVEKGDNLYVNLPTRYGYANLPVEVLDTAFTLDGGIQLSLKHTSSTIFDMGTSFAGANPAPNTILPSPFDLPEVESLTVSSNSSVQVMNPDGTILQRMRVSWDPIEDPGVLASGGGVEIRYGEASWPEEQWISVLATNGQNQIDITGVKQGQIYLVKARTFNGLVSATWTLPTLHRVGVVVSVSAIATETAISAVNVTGQSGIPSGSWTTLASYTFTPTVSGYVNLELEAEVEIVTNATNTGFLDDYASIFTRVRQDTTSLEASVRIRNYEAVVGLAKTVRVSINRTRRVAVTAGVSTTLDVQAQRVSPTNTTTVTGTLKTEYVRG